MSDISWDTQVANGAQVSVLGFHPMFRYGVIVEGDFLYAEFDFGGFDLYACFRTAAQKGLIEVIQLFKRICPCGYVIAIDRELVSEGLRTAIRVQETLTTLVE